MLKQLLLPAVVLGVVAVLAACLSSEEQPEDESLGSGTPSTVPGGIRTTDASVQTCHQVLQPPSQTLHPDLAQIAEANGWTVEEALTHEHTSGMLDGVVQRLSEARREVYVGSALTSDDPLGCPSLYIKGPADDFVRNVVAAAEIEIRIVDNQPYSWTEMDERVSTISQALRALGFYDVSAGWRPSLGGDVEAAVTQQQGLPSDPDKILSRLPEHLRDGVRLTVSPFEPDDDYGPLAVVPASTGRDLPGGPTGVVLISEECVNLRATSGELYLLGWHGNDVHWNDDERAIIFDSIKPDDAPITIIDGDVVSLGSSSWEPREWLSPPHPSCEGQLEVVNFLELGVNSE